MPLGTEATWAGDYRYTLGDALLVAPILDATGIRDIELPAGTWYDWWDPGGAAIAGGQTLVAYARPERDRIPLFVREGAILTANVGSDVSGIGTAARADALTVLAWPGAADSTFELVDEDEAATTITTSTAAVELSRALRTTYVRVRRAAAPTTVSLDGVSLGEVATDAALDAAATGWRYDAANNFLTIKIAASPDAATRATIQ